MSAQIRCQQPNQAASQHTPMVCVVMLPVIWNQSSGMCQGEDFQYDDPGCCHWNYIRREIINHPTLSFNFNNCRADRCRTIRETGHPTSASVQPRGMLIEINLRLLIFLQHSSFVCLAGNGFEHNCRTLITFHSLACIN